VDGKCSACISHENRPEIDWDAREDDLQQLLDRHDGKCIVPSSGGKDSTYQVITLLNMGADVTVVTARTCHLTDIGRENIDNLARFAPTIEVVPNMADRAELNRAGLDMVGDISLPEHWAIFSTPFRMAVQLGIPLIMYGENPQSQYGGPMTELGAKIMTRRWTHEFGGFLGMRPSDITGMDMSYYTLPGNLEGIEAHFLGAYIPWDSHHNAEVAMAHGMRTFGKPPSEANWWEWENLDNAQTGVHDYLMYLKYGYGRVAAQMSVDIRTGRMSRDDGLKLLERMDGKYPSYYAGVSLEEILGRIGITVDRFDNLVERYAGAQNNPAVTG